jgi:ABC-type antimicrobial peptide transport system permease subunit
MALGADRGRVVLLILRDSSVVVLGGILLGLGPAWAAAQWVRSEFTEFAPQDPGMLGVAMLVLILVAFADAYLPARRASRLDPMIALRQA